MDRKNFIRSLGLLPLAALAEKNQNTFMELNDLDRISLALPSTPRMPAIFVGHGNPMNAIVQNQYSKTWSELGKKLPHPQAILCISAHWLTNGTSVAVTKKPETIHDFGGFPDELFKVQYPAPGAPDYAKMAANSVKGIAVHEDPEFGLDHGAWSVLKNMYPGANVPVFQLSIDYGKSPQFHYDLGKQLAVLRNKGVLIIGSGNVVHNLGMVSWNDPSKKYDWAVEFDQVVRRAIETRDHQKLIGFTKLGQLATLAHPTPDHYYPLLYILALQQQNEGFSFFNDTFDMGSISMRGVIFS